MHGFLVSRNDAILGGFLGSWFSFQLELSSYLCAFCRITQTQTLPFRGPALIPFLTCSMLPLPFSWLLPEILLISYFSKVQLGGCYKGSKTYTRISCLLCWSGFNYREWNPFHPVWAERDLLQRMKCLTDFQSGRNKVSAELSGMTSKTTLQT